MLRRLLYVVAACAIASGCSGRPMTTLPMHGTARSATSAMTGSSYPTTVLALSPSQYFQLNETTGPTAFDSSSSAINGAYIGALTYATPGPLLDEPSTAISLPGGGASEGVSLPNPNAVSGTSYSIDTWVYPGLNTGYMTIWGYNYSHRVLLNGSGQLLSQFSGSFYSKETLSRNQWHDVVFVYNANQSTESFFIDGALDGTAALSNASGAFTAAYYLGQYDSSTNYKWKGRLAQHAFYKTALTGAQVQQLYTAAGYTVSSGSPGPSSSPSPAPTGVPTTSPSPVPTSVPSPGPTVSPTPSPTAAPTQAPTPVPSGPPPKLPSFQSSFTYAGTTYTYRMVGSNPMTSPTSTTIADEIVPVQLVFSNGISLDPSPVVGNMQNSPLFTSASYAAGNTQYGDALMRSSFWKYAAGTNYHVLLAAPFIEPTVQVLVPSADGYATTSSGSTEGYVAFNWLIETIEPQIIQQLGISPSSLAIFATYHTKVLEQGGYCCYGGYHAVLQVTTPNGAATATTVWSSVTATSVGAMEHEIAEWLNDPFYNNRVPSWRNPQNGACNGDLLEVGDPEPNYVMNVNGWDMQDEVFLSWFSRDVPSIGINGMYDLMGKLTSPATSC